MPLKKSHAADWGEPGNGMNASLVRSFRQVELDVSSMGYQVEVSSCVEEHTSKSLCWIPMLFLGRGFHCEVNEHVNHKGIEVVPRPFNQHDIPKKYRSWSRLG